MTRSRRACVALAAFIIASAPVAAQAPGEARFEVAGVRPAAPKAQSAQRATETRLEVVNTSLRVLVEIAFGLEPFELEAPD